MDIRLGARRGYGLLIIAIVTAMMVALISLSVTKLNQSAFAGINNSKIMLQAQQYAETEAQKIKVTNYSNLIAHGKTQIQNSKFTVIKYYAINTRIEKNSSRKQIRKYRNRHIRA